MSEVPVCNVDVVLTALPLERVVSDVAVAGFFTDERPLRGGAARADWRLCGGLSRRIESGDLSGKSGEAMLIATGRALFAPRLMLLGLGDRGGYDQLRVSDEFRQALERVRKLRVPHVSLAPLGIAPVTGSSGNGTSESAIGGDTEMRNSSDSCNATVVVCGVGVSISGR